MKKLRLVFLILLAISVFVLMFMFFDQFKQKKDADIKLSHKVYEVGYISDLADLEKAQTFTSFTDLKKFFESKKIITDREGDVAEYYNEDILKDYNASFFNKNNLSIVYVSISSSNKELEVKKIYNEGNKVVVRYDVTTKEDTMGAAVMNGYIIAVTSPKSIEKVIIK